MAHHNDCSLLLVAPRIKKMNKQRPAELSKDLEQKKTQEILKVAKNKERCCHTKHEFEEKRQRY